MTSCSLIGFLIGFVVIISTSTASESLSCYQCGIRDDKSDACETLPAKPSSSFIVQCPPNGFCTKTISREMNGDLKMEATRGCASRVTVSKRQHAVGCSIDQRTGTVVCYCDTFLCNASNILRSNLYAILLCITVTAYYLRTQILIPSTCRSSQ